jgi:lysophospholipase L1-like esterase
MQSEKVNSFNWSLYSIVRIVVVIVTIGFLLLFFHQKTSYLNPSHVAKPTPTDKPFETYIAPKIHTKSYYKIAMFGDSMTQELGIYGGHLNDFLNKKFGSTPGNQKIVIYNYAIGSTNVLDLHRQLTSSLTTKNNESLESPLTFKPDIILIESFGYNPLSQLGIEDGLKKQTQTLLDEMKYITKNLPNSAIIFVATIAPNKETYGLQENPNESIDGRAAEAQERIDYIKNHMAFASLHNIPLIDIFDKSLTQDGDGNILYINPVDHIHPSATGTDFIDDQIANYIFESQILPK